MTDDRLSELLDNWAAYMRSGNYGRGFPSRSAGFACETRIQEWDDLAEEVGGMEVEAVNAVVWSLDTAYRDAVLAVKLNATWRHPATLEAVYVEARDRVRDGLMGRGVE